MSEPTYLRAILVDYLQGEVSFGRVCEVWKRPLSESYHALLDAGLKDATNTPGNVDKLYRILLAL